MRIKLSDLRMGLSRAVGAPEASVFPDVGEMRGVEPCCAARLFPVEVMVDEK